MELIKNTQTTYVIYGFKYMIHTHVSPSNLDMHIMIIQDMTNQLKAIRTIIKIQLRCEN